MTVYVFGGNSNPAYDTFVWASEPAKPHSGLTYAIVGDGTANYQWGSGFGAIPNKSTIVSAILRVFSAGDWGGSRKLSAFSANADWQADKSVWNNRPGTSGAGVDVTHVVGGPGVQFSFDLTTQFQAQWASGDTPGFIVKFTDGGSEERIFSRNASGPYLPVLIVEATAPGQKPSKLSPNGYVGVPKPMLSGFPKGTQAVRVFADPDEDGFGAPVWSSGTQDVKAPQFDLASSTFPGSSEGDTWWYVISTQDQGGDWSDPSDPVHFTYEPLLEFEITGPSEAVPFITDPSPTFTRSEPDPFYTVTGERLFVTVSGDQHGDHIWDTGKLTGDDIGNSHTMPSGKITTRKPYRLWWELFDQFDRVAVAGSLPYARDAQDFTLVDVPGVPPVSSISATQVDSSPVIRVHWSCEDAGTPDQFNFWRDNELLLANMDPADFVDPDEDGWVFLDDTAPPQTEHDYYVQRVVNGNSSIPGPHAAITTVVGGDWLVDAARDLSVFLVEATQTTFDTQDQIIVVYPSGSQRPVAFSTQIGWKRGVISGLIMEYPGSRSLEEQEADWDAIRQAPLVSVQWASGNKMYAVILWNMQAAREPKLPRTLRLTANYAQVGRERAEGSLPGPGEPIGLEPDFIYRYADLGLDDGEALTVGFADITAVAGTPKGEDDAIVPGHTDTEGWS